jgi:hypothetical protein
MFEEEPSRISEHLWFEDDDFGKLGLDDVHALVLKRGILRN